MEEKIEYFMSAEITEETVKAFTEHFPEDSNCRLLNIHKEDPRLNTGTLLVELRDGTIVSTKHMFYAYPERVLDVASSEKRTYFGFIVKVHTKRLSICVPLFPGSLQIKKVATFETINTSKKGLTQGWNGFFIIEVPGPPGHFYYDVCYQAASDSETTVLSVNFSEKRKQEQCN